MAKKERAIITLFLSPVLVGRRWVWELVQQTPDGEQASIQVATKPAAKKQITAAIHDRLRDGWAVDATFIDQTGGGVRAVYDGAGMTEEHIAAKDVLGPRCHELPRAELAASMRRKMLSHRNTWADLAARLDAGQIVIDPQARAIAKATQSRKPPKWIQATPEHFKVVQAAILEGWDGAHTLGSFPPIIGMPPGLPTQVSMTALLSGKPPARKPKPKPKPSGRKPSAPKPSAAKPSGRKPSAPKPSGRKPSTSAPKPPPRTSTSAPKPPTAKPPTAKPPSGRKPSAKPPRQRRTNEQIFIDAAKEAGVTVSAARSLWADRPAGLRGADAIQKYARKVAGGSMSSKPPKAPSGSRAPSVPSAPRVPSGQRVSAPRPSIPSAPPPLPPSGGGQAVSIPHLPQPPSSPGRTSGSRPAAPQGGGMTPEDMAILLAGIKAL